MKIPLIAALLFVAGCKGSHEDVVKEEREGQKEISAAQQKVEETKADARRDIDKAEARGRFDQAAERKTEATKDIAKAERKVDDEKVEATEEINDAKRKAGETTGTFTRE